MPEPQRVGRFVLGDELGRGGMGVVYRAYDPRLDREVALKVIHAALSSDPVYRQRFAREARAAARVTHLHVVPVFESSEEGAEPAYLVMPFVAGRDLGVLLEEVGRLDARTTASLVAQVASALDAVHAQGLVHRDVKPANVLVTDDVDGLHASLTDFGVARPTAAGGGMTATGLLVGSPAFMAPEQVHGERADRRTDVYALGTVAYLCLAGGLPFDADTDMALLWAQAHAEPRDLRESAPDVPVAVAAAVGRALAKDPAERWQTAGELGTALRRAVSGAPAAPARAGATRPGVAAPPPGLDAGAGAGAGRPGTGRAVATVPRPAARDGGADPGAPTRATGGPPARVPEPRPRPQAAAVGAPAPAPPHRRRLHGVALAAAVLVLAGAAATGGVALARWTEPGRGPDPAVPTEGGPSAEPPTEERPADEPPADGPPAEGPSVEEPVPTGAEARDELVAALPGTRFAACEDFPAARLDDHLATLRCEPVLPGADEVQVARYRDLDAMQAEFRDVYHRYPDGKCSLGPEVRSTWARGVLACYTNREGDAVILWEYDDRPVQVVAVRYDGDHEALYAWWLETARVPLVG